MEFVARTDVGICRSENQDSVCTFVHAGFLVGVVADGMGGHNGGSIASQMAVSCLKEKLLSGLTEEASTSDVMELLREAYFEANARIYKRAQEDVSLQGMGTTLTVAVLKGDRVLVSNIGDSRAYLLDREKISQLTVDQTLVQRLVDSGKITAEEAKTHPHRNVILEAVGTNDAISPEFYVAKLDGDVVLLCSDGLSGEVGDDRMLEIAMSAKSIAQAADVLISEANAAGGGDNITVALLKVQSQDTTKGSART